MASESLSGSHWNLRGKSHLEKRSSEINFLHIHAKARAKLKLDRLIPVEKSGFCFGVWSTRKYIFVGRENGVLSGFLEPLDEWEYPLYPCVASCTRRFPRLYQHRGKWIMLLNILNQGLNLVLLSASLSIFTSLDSNVKALPSTMTA